MPFDAIELEDWQKTLLKAAEEVRKGWCQFARQDEQGRVCVIGAMARVSAGDPEAQLDPDEYPAALIAWERLRDHLGLGYGGLPRWNNAPERTAEEVASVMEAVALGGK